MRASDTLDFTRTVIAIAKARENREEAARIATQRWGASSMPAMILRSAVAAGMTLNTGDWGSQLIFTGTVAKFFDRVAEQTVIGRMSADLQKVPFLIPVIAPTSPAMAYWRGDGSPAPVTKIQFGRASISPLSVSALLVATDQLLELEDPQAEARIETDLINAVALVTDQAFVDPGNAGTANVKPASVTHGATTIHSSGNMRDDMAALVEAYTGDLTRTWLVTSPGFIAAAAASGKWPDADVRTGGQLLGFPALSTNAWPAAGSPATHSLALIDASSIALAEGEATIRASKQASVQMSDGPNQPASLVSVFQIDATAILVDRATNWEVARPGAVAVLDRIDPSSL